jgi:uncharacterized membrane-anchored protein YhcB (DUF1043 family)
MSQQKGFTGGFLAGAVLGGVIGGVIGVVITSWRKNLLDDELTSLPKSEQDVKLEKKDEMENTRRNLEDQIGQIRSTMDDMSQQLRTVIEHSAAEQ